MTDSNETTVKTFFKTISGSTSTNKDSEEFLERLRTYIVGQKWVRRPLILSPAKCARYGWKCKSYNLLECVTCGAKICSSEPNINMPDVYKACMEKVLAELKSGHKTHCPWPLTPAPESLVKMVTVPKEDALKIFLQRLNQCHQLSSFLPKIQASCIMNLGLNEKLILELCNLGGISAEEAKTFGANAVSLAATGWTLVSNSDGDQKTSIECKSCQRSIWSGSFNLNSASQNENTAETSTNGNCQNGKLEESPRVKRFKKDDFNPLEEHRPWCLWIVSESNCSLSSDNSSDPDIPGWRIFMKSLLRNVTDPDNENSEVNPTKEHIRNVRDLLETWTDPIE